MTNTATKQDFALETGQHAPQLNLPTDQGGQVNIADYQGNKKVVVYFYPKDDTPGCTTEAKDFRNHLAEFEAADTVIVGVSKDSVKKHDAFKAKHELNFMLASDEDGDVCERWGVWGEKNMYGKKYMGITRATFLIDKSGKIARIWPKVKVNGHVAEVLEAAKTL